MDEYSVLMSLYCKEKPEYFRAALDSMLHQTFKPNEIVVVVDGPITDNLNKIIDEYCNSNPKLFRIVKNEINLGLGLSLKKGVKACKNDFIARMDTDDISISDRCEKQLKFLISNPQISVVGGQIVEFIDSIDNTIGKRLVPLNDTDIKKYIKYRCPFNHMSVMFRKSSVISSGNYMDWFWNEDYYLWVRMLLNGAFFANLPNILVNVRVGKEMYSRRGGIKYFKSEAKLQKYMYKNKIIGLSTYFSNVAKRLIVQVLMPNKIRGFIFKKFAREK